MALVQPVSGRPASPCPAEGRGERSPSPGCCLCKRPAVCTWCRSAQRELQEAEPGISTFRSSPRIGRLQLLWCSPFCSGRSGRDPPPCLERFLGTGSEAVCGCVVQGSRPCTLQRVSEIVLNLLDWWRLSLGSQASEGHCEKDACHAEKGSLSPCSSVACSVAEVPLETLFAVRELRFPHPFQVGSSTGCSHGYRCCEKVGQSARGCKYCAEVTLA